MTESKRGAERAVVRAAMNYVSAYNEFTSIWKCVRTLRVLKKACARLAAARGRK